MNFTVFTKPICRFLIQRYMGQYLHTELSSDQLEFRLADGVASVQRVKLNTEYINEILDPVGVVSLMEGYVEEISTCVPWKNLMSESTIIKIRGLELTLTPLSDINMAKTQELVSSMIGSIASSMDLARSVIADEQIASGVENAGVEQFASLIDQVISRIKVIFEDVIIRVEAYSDVCTGLEIQIDQMEFVDEQLEARQQQQKLDGEAITVQPSSLYTVTDLNKLLHLQGVRFYTDVWTSFREQRLSTSRMTTDDGEDPNFQSCYSHFSSRSTINFFENHPNSIPPNHVPFAQFANCDKHTIRIRVNNTALASGANGVYNKRVDIDIFFGGSLFIYLTPSQISQLKDLFSRMVPKPSKDETVLHNFGGRPMRPEHFQKLTEQFHNDATTGGVGGAAAGSFGGWGGQEEFFEFSNAQHTKTDAFCSSFSTNQRQSNDGSSLILNRSNSINSDAFYSAHLNQGSNGSTATLVDKRPDMLTVTMRAPNLVGIVTHDDPLGFESEHGDATDCTTNFAAIRTAITTFAEEAHQFFEKMENLKLARQRLDTQRDMLAQLCGRDHLRIVANGTVFSLTVITEYGQSSIELEGSLEDCDFVECLQPSSIINYKGDKACHFDIINLSDQRSNSAKNVFTFRVANSMDNPQDFSIDFNMETCRTEFDPSIVDRLSNLFAFRSIITVLAANDSAGVMGNGCVITTYSDDLTSPGLRDNFLPDAMNTETPTTYRVKFYVAKWIINLRVPIADLSENSPDYRKQHLHPEYMNIVLQGAHLEVPKFLPHDLLSHGTMILQCKMLTSSFAGDLGVLNCLADELCFMHADSSSGLESSRNSIKLAISYDTRNKSLRAANTGLLSESDGGMSSGRAMCESIYRPRAEDVIDGPFSKTSTYFANTKLVMAGSRDELFEFSEECRPMTNVNIEFSMSSVNFFLPSHKFFEVLYNRLANDLALWEPKSPALRYSTPKAESALRFGQFTECKSYAQNPEYNDGLNDDFESNRYDRDSHLLASSSSNPSNLSKSHIFSFTLRVEKASILLQTYVEEEKFISQIGSQLKDAEMFFVYGYNEDPNLSYFYATSSKANIFHRNLLEGVDSFSKNVTDLRHFAEHLAIDLHVEAVPDDEPCSTVEDDNFAVSLRISLNPDENLKDILLALAVRNTLVYFRPFNNSRMYWIDQFANFFNVLDYGVPGYVLPVVKMDLHVHLTSVLFGYDHSSVMPNSPMQLRLEIGSCDLNSRMTAEMERLKFHCLLEDTRLWMRNRPFNKSPKTVSFGGNPTKKTCSMAPFVKVAFVGLLHTTVDYTATTETNTTPLLELACTNDLIKLWICSDTSIELLNMITEFISSEVGAYLISANSATEAAAGETAVKNSAEQQLNDIFNKSDMLSSFHSAFAAQQNQLQSTQASACVNGTASAPYQSDLSAEEADRLAAMMASAMRETPLVSEAVRNRQHRRRQNQCQSLAMTNHFDITEAEEFEDDDNASEERDDFSSSNNENTDDEFILIEKLPNKSSTFYGPGRSTHHDLRVEPDFEMVSMSVRLPETSADDDMTTLPPNHPPPIFKFSVKDLSIYLYMYGGNDFGTSYGAQKTYSKWEPVRQQRDPHLAAQHESEGGPFRDHTVCVEAKISKISFVRELFDATGQMMSLSVLKVGDIEVLDHLIVSDINKIFYMYTSHDQPRRVRSPFFSVHMTEDYLREGRIKISIMPIRLNFDQDTLEFIQEFIANVQQNVKFPDGTIFNADLGHQVPVMEMPPPSPRASSPIINNIENNNGILIYNECGSVLFSNRNRLPASVETTVNSPIVDLLTGDYDLSDIDFSRPRISTDEDEEQSGWEGASEMMRMGAMTGSTSTAGGKSVAKILDVTTGANGVGGESNALETSTSTARTESTTTQQNALSAPMPSGVVQPSAVAASRETFYKEFIFSPACKIRLDYVGKRVKTDQGALIGLLIGLANLHRTELELKELHSERGMLGLGKCAQYAIDEWVNDIRMRQLPNVIGSYTPISALVELAQGVCDLFLIPLSEMRKEDGHVVRGIQQGASSFSINTATAAIDATQRLAGLIQTIAEFAFDLVTPDFAYRQHLAATNALVPSRNRVAGDVREGFTMAYDVVRESVWDTAQTLSHAAQSDRASGGGRWGIRGLLRQATPTAIRPIVIASQATIHVLSGIKNQLRPDDHREELEKWRNTGSFAAVAGSSTSSSASIGVRRAPYGSTAPTQSPANAFGISSAKKTNPCGYVVPPLNRPVGSRRY